LAAVVGKVGCGGKGGDKDTRAGASPAPTSDTSHQPAGATLAVAHIADTMNTFTDTRDGKTYRTVKIGKQVWMAENLNYKTDNSWCYDDNPDNGKKYGRLYTWYAAKAACPAGWHLPVREEWAELVNFAGGKNIAGTKLKSKSPDWDGTDDYGFSALPGGCYFAGRESHALGSWGNWWMADAYYAAYGYAWRVDTGYASASEYGDDKDLGMSVRCLRD
jgi:uncharacterized protein (TIGR02145 family)